MVRQETRKERSFPIKNCKHLIVNSKGYGCCIYNLDFPCYCTVENCPLRKEAKKLDQKIGAEHHGQR